MVEPLPLLVGSAVVGAVVVDVLWTTLWVDGGAGPLTSAITGVTWRVARRGRDWRRWLGLAGPGTLVVGLAAWLGLLWLGWTLVFAASEASLIDTVDGGPISWTERVYFVGYSLFTLGNGDYAPPDGPWQIATVLTTATGMLFVTLTVTYVLNVLGAVTQKRAFAAGVTGLGDSAEEVVVAGWDGEDLRELDRPLQRYARGLDELVANHQAYPILHYFHSARSESAAATSVAALDEAVSIVDFGVAEDCRPSDVSVTSARSSVDSYVELLQDRYLDEAAPAPPPPDLDRVRAAGIPTADDDAFEAALAEDAERRRVLRAAVRSDAREWPAGDQSDG